MSEQLLGAASALVLVLAYVLIVQAMMAAVVLLSEFIIVRLRVLASLVPRLGDNHEVASSSVGEVDSRADSPSYRLGGHVRW